MSLLAKERAVYSDALWIQWVEIQKSTLKMLRYKDFDGALDQVNSFLATQSAADLIGEILMLRANIEKRRGRLAEAKEDLLRAYSISSPATYHRYVLALSLAALAESVGGDTDEANNWYVQALETVVADPLTSGAAAVEGLTRRKGWTELSAYERELCETALSLSWELFKLPAQPDFDDITATLSLIKEAFSRPLPS